MFVDVTKVKDWSIQRIVWKRLEGFEMGSRATDNTSILIPSSAVAQNHITRNVEPLEHFVHFVQHRHLSHFGTVGGRRC